MAYHVLHEGRRMGPYDRRTIVGLRIKKTLSSGHELEASDGSRLTVGELLGRPEPSGDANAMQSGEYSSARFICTGGFIESDPGPHEIPLFRGEVQVRVHPDVLRIAGSFRTGRAIREGRVKLPLKDIVFSRSTGSRVDLWLREADAPVAGAPLQRLAVDMFSDDTARELLHWLPDASPWPHADAPSPSAPAGNAPVRSVFWAALVGTLVAGFMLWVMLRGEF